MRMDISLQTFVLNYVNKLQRDKLKIIIQGLFLNLLTLSTINSSSKINLLYTQINRKDYNRQSLITSREIPSNQLLKLIVKLLTTIRLLS